MRRVAITGIGAISALGRNTTEFWDAPVEVGKQCLLDRKLFGDRFDHKVGISPIVPVINGSGNQIARAMFRVDRRGEAAIGAPCGGTAEEAWLAAQSPNQDGAVLRLVDRFDASPRTSISVYWSGDAP